MWEGMGEEFKFYLVSGSNVCSLISEGVLGVQNFPMINRALLGKWLWCSAYEREVL
jgi:hypothetical protein